MSNKERTNNRNLIAVQNLDKIGKVSKNNLWQEISELGTKAFRTLSKVLRRDNSLNQEKVISILYEDPKNSYTFGGSSYYKVLRVMGYLADIHRYVVDKKYGNNIEIENYEVSDVTDKKELIDTYKPNAVSKIIFQWINNKEVVEVTSIHPLLNSKAFLDNVHELKLKVISQEEPYLSQQICSALHYISNKREIIKYGDPKIGEFNVSQADKFAREMGVIFDELDELGVKSIMAKTEELNNKGLKAFRGNKWSKTSVHRTYTRWKEIKAEEAEHDSNSAPPKKTSKPE